MGNEANLTWAPLLREIKRRGLHHQRFEDRLTSGIPDVNVFIPPSSEWWLELKYAVPSPSGNIEIGLRREQRIWLRQADRAGRKVLLVARVAENELDRFYAWDRPDVWDLVWKPCCWPDIRALAVAKSGFATAAKLLDWITDTGV